MHFICLIVNCWIAYLRIAQPKKKFVIYVLYKAITGRFPNKKAIKNQQQKHTIYEFMAHNKPYTFNSFMQFSITFYKYFLFYFFDILNCIL